MVRTCQEEIIRLRQGETVTLCTGQSISGANRVSGALDCYDRWTLYIATSGACSLTLQLSPDTTTPPIYWFNPSESPIVFAAAGSGVYEMGYDATYIRLQSNNPSGVTAICRGCW